jgi:hypothetical protein
MRFLSFHAPRSVTRFLAKAGVALGIFVAPAVVLADVFTVYVDMHTPSGGTDIVSRIGLIIDTTASTSFGQNTATSGWITGFDLSLTNSYLYSYTTGNSTFVSGTTGTVGGAIPAQCVNGGTCWTGTGNGNTFPVPNIPIDALAPKTVSLAGQGVANVGDVVLLPLGTYSSTATGVFTIESLNFGFQDQTGSNWWIEGTGGQSANWDLHSASYNGTSWTRNVGPSGNGNLVNNTKLVCAGTTSAGPCTASLLPEIDASAFPKAVLLIGSLLLVVRSRRRLVA